jgi:hypothetical protein
MEKTETRRRFDIEIVPQVIDSNWGNNYGPTGKIYFAGLEAEAC